MIFMQVASNSSQHVELMLQESCTDQSGSLVVYSTIDVDSVQLAMSGEDPSCIPLLPIGFVIVPATSSASTNNSIDTPAEVVPSSEDKTNGGATQGCLLTVGLQVVASAIPTAKLNLSSIAAINTHLCNTVHQINAALGNNTTTTTTTATTDMCTDDGSGAVGSCPEPAATTPSKQ